MPFGIKRSPSKTVPDDGELKITCLLMNVNESGREPVCTTLAVTGNEAAGLLSYFIIRSPYVPTAQESELGMFPVYV